MGCRVAWQSACRVSAGGTASAVAPRAARTCVPNPVLAPSTSAAIVSWRVNRFYKWKAPTAWCSTEPSGCGGSGGINFFLHLFACTSNRHCSVLHMPVRSEGGGGWRAGKGRGRQRGEAQDESHRPDLSCPCRGLALLLLRLHSRLARVALDGVSLEQVLRAARPNPDGGRDDRLRPEEDLEKVPA